MEQEITVFSSLYRPAEQIFLLMSSARFVPPHHYPADIYKCSSFAACFSGSPVLTAAADPTSIPRVTAPTLFHSRDLIGITGSAGMLHLIPGGQRAATGMYCSQFTHHITHMAATEEYSHTMVTHAVSPNRWTTRQHLSDTCFTSPPSPPPLLIFRRCSSSLKERCHLVGKSPIWHTSQFELKICRISMKPAWTTVTFYIAFHPRETKYL